MRAIVFGTGKIYNDFLIYCSSTELDWPIDIVCLCDNSPDKQGKILNGKKIIEPARIPGMVQSSSVDALILTIGRQHLRSVLRQLQALNLNLKIYFFNQSAPEHEKMSLMHPQKPILPYLECDLLDHCNLNCRGCGHLSNLMPERYLHELDFEHDFSRLSQLFESIDTIRLMGGEPLLHPKLHRFLFITRNNFPYANLRVVTNGLLLPSVSQEVFQAMKKCQAVLDISLYPPTFQRWKEIKSVLTKNDISYHLTEPIVTFSRFCDTKKVGDYHEIFNRCTDPCFCLYDGMLSRCGFGRMIQRIKRFFPDESKDFWCEVDNNLTVPIHNQELDGLDVNNLLSRPSKLCAYCHSPGWEENLLFDPDLQFPWENGKQRASIEDWCYAKRTTRFD